MAGPFLEMRNLTKSFGIVKALKDVSFSVEKGEIHTLLGENGAGKSTLVKIIMGEQGPDSGQILLEGEAFAEYTPGYSRSLGISMVHQELAIFENMTVAENIFTNCEFRNSLGLLDRKSLNRAARDSLRTLDLDIDPDAKLDSLSVAHCQMVEILRCISSGQRIILLDEPTSSLNSDETDKLFAVLRKLRGDGITIIFISHRMTEILGISDRISIMRDGRYITTFSDVPNVTEAELISQMVGNDLSRDLYSRKEYVRGGGELFTVEGLGRRHAAEDISFSLAEGEILGVFGLEGSGTESVSRMLYGLEAKDSGRLSYRGKPIRRVTPPSMSQRRIAYLSNNRKQAGLLMDSPAVDNMSIPVVDSFSRLLFLQTRRLVEYTANFVKAFSISIPSVFSTPRRLSGGNQQKLMLSICLGTKPEMLIVNEPTRGIDVGAKAEIHEFLRADARNGMSIIVFSSEMHELIALCDRVIVMRNQRIVGELAAEAITETGILTLAATGE